MGMARVGSSYQEGTVAVWNTFVSGILVWMLVPAASGKRELY